MRESRRDKWKPRPSVVRYRAYRDECNLRRVWQPTPGDLVVFLLPIANSLPAKAKMDMDGQPHLGVPDVDNLMKALLDALYVDDREIWMITAAKLWSLTPGIYIQRREPIAIPMTVVHAC